MLEKYFSAPKTLRRFRSGISGPHIDAFADDLEPRARLFVIGEISPSITPTIIDTS